MATTEDLDWIGEAGFVFQTPVRAKKGKQSGGGGSKKKGGGEGGPDVGALLARIARVTQRRPEVMVKVTGSARGRKHLREHLNYITRNGELVGEREDGTQIEGLAAVREMAGEWWALREDDDRRNARDTMNIILSMPAGTDRGALAEAARVFAHYEFGGKHDYLLVHHEDTDHPHAHLTVKTVGYQGQRLNPRKADLQGWREGFAEQLRARGIAAEATPRRARGQVRKPIRQVIGHMNERGASRVTRSKIKEAIKTARAGAGQGTGASEPWRGAIEARLKKNQKAWATIAKALDGMGEVALAVHVKHFAADLPTAVVTERDAILRDVQQRLDKHLEREEQTQKRR
jgi:type IV secretory pathway VirD2 relaxase